MEKNRKNAVAKTPPMGWNSWDCYMSTITEEELLENASYLATHLKKYGWEYAVCDIQWYEPTAGTLPGYEYIPFAELTMDAYGRLLPAENRFPSAKNGKGFAPIAQKIHDMGLKFGIHIMRGIPKQAVYAKTPILGTEKTADQIATPFSICKWNGDMFGLRADVPEAQGYYNSIFDLYAQWGVDYIKVDDIANTNLYTDNPYSAKHEIEMIRRAIDQCGRPMVLSVSPGPAPIEHAWHLAKNTNMWRMTDDFWDDWKLLKNMFYRCEVWQKHVGPGCWPDCDMLPLGKIGIRFGKERMTRFTLDEQRTMMTLWSIFRSPLMLGGKLVETDPQTLAFITNEEVLRLNRHSYGAWQVYRNEEEAAWVSYDENGSIYVALFNLSQEEKEVTLFLEEIEQKQGMLRDLWEKRDQGIVKEKISEKIPPHGAKLYQLRDLS
ncbi:MAG: glycoside hydrolase family 27 protein [Clostridiales bacterium]|nr:glycoside hydrolase family 27 protein [Clostridiales bacterium]